MGRHRSRPSARHRPSMAVRLTGVAVLVVAVTAVALTPVGGGPSTRTSPSSGGTRSHPSARPRLRPHAALRAPWTTAAGLAVPRHLAAGSNATALPMSVLIADKLNNRLIVVDPQGRIRWQFPTSGALRRGETFRVPDDAFFTPDGRYIIATQEDQSVITLIDVATNRITYRYGVPGHPGPTANHLNNPDDAMVLPNRDILSADIKNCRLLLVAPGAHKPRHVIGRTTTSCLHDPPRRWGSPNGVFPMRNGHYLVTEINGDWVDEIDLTGRVYWSTHPPGVSYPSDTNEISANRYLTVDYSAPGQVIEFDKAGHTLWRYRGRGSGALDHPSLALPLRNGNILINDDFDHRVVVIDPRTDRIVWQYGVTGKPGTRPGYLDNPDGVDLVPPHSLLVTHAVTMGTWP